MRIARHLTVGLFSVTLGAGLALASAGTAQAEGLPALTVTPSPVSTSSGFTLSGSGCVDNDAGGVANVTIIYPDGHDEFGGSYDADVSGNWSAEFTPAGDGDAVPQGTYTLKVTCDTYEGTLAYPDKQFNANDVIKAPAASISDTTVTAGQQVVVGIEGFQAEQPVEIYLYSDPVLLGTVVTDLNGEASATLTIPAATTAGTHTIVVTAADGTQVEIQITVYDATVVAVTGPELADTGTEAAGLGWLAGGLLASGGAALYAGRRRR